jgi:hypothetical protein
MTEVGDVTMKVSDVMTEVGDVTMKVSDVMTEVGDVMTEVDVTMKVSDVMTEVANVTIEVSNVMIGAADVMSFKKWVIMRFGLRFGGDFGYKWAVFVLPRRVCRRRPCGK